MNKDILDKLQVFLFVLLAFSLPLSLTLSETFYFLAFVVWIAKIVFQGKKCLHWTKLEVPILILALASVLAVLFSPSPLESARIVRKLIKFGLIFLLANNLASEAEKSRLINTWFLGVIIASVW
ncbi:MAG: hypothetical protein ACYS9C_17340, partial [Planctomycetota bacterium]